MRSASEFTVSAEFPVTLDHDGQCEGGIYLFRMRDSLATASSSSSSSAMSAPTSFSVTWSDVFGVEHSFCMPLAVPPPLAAAETATPDCDLGLRKAFALSEYVRCITDYATESSAAASSASAAAAPFHRRPGMQFRGGARSRFGAAYDSDDDEDSDSDGERDSDAEDSDADEVDRAAVAAAVARISAQTASKSRKIASAAAAAASSASVALDANSEAGKAATKPSMSAQSAAALLALASSGSANGFASASSSAGAAASLGAVLVAAIVARLPAPFGAYSEAAVRALLPADTPTKLLASVCAAVKFARLDTFLRAEMAACGDASLGSSNQNVAQTIAQVITLESKLVDRALRKLQAASHQPNRGAATGAAASSATEAEVAAAPRGFVCPITLGLMRRPTLAADGHSYERAAIRQWLARGHRKSPATNALLKHTELVPNHALRASIDDWLTQRRAAPSV